MLKNGCVCRKGAYESQEDKTFKKGEGTGTKGGWRSNCMSRRRRNKEKGKVEGRIHSTEERFSEEYDICCEHRVFRLWLLIRGGTELLEVLGMGAMISVDILELGSFPSW
jgi:hypothetical protein